MDTPKLDTEPAIFAGYARAFKINPDAFFSVSLGSWLGGDASHSPCYDQVGKDYYCATVTPWSDFRQSKIKLQRYAHFILEKSF